MTLKAPFGDLLSPAPKSKSLEREIWFEALGCCWALSVKNVEGRFPIQLMMDLAKCEGPSGNLVKAIGGAKFNDLIQAFSRRIPSNRDGQAITERNARYLINKMDLEDFLCFMAGMSDTVDEQLRTAFFWDEQCQTNWLSLRFYSLNLIEAKQSTAAQRAHFAELLASFLQHGQHAYRAYGPQSEFGLY